MPIYEYACAACGHTFEEWQKMSDPPVRTCPKCKKKKVEKLISHTAFQLKGGGWYADLYSSSKGKAKGEGGDTKSPGGESASSDSKPKESGSSDSGSAGGNKEVKGDSKVAKKKDTAKKSESRAA